MTTKITSKITPINKWIKDVEELFAERKIVRTFPSLRRARKSLYSLSGLKHTIRHSANTKYGFAISPAQISYLLKKIK